MKARETLREAWRDIAAGVARSVPVALVQGALWAAIAMTQAAALSADVRGAFEYRASAANVYVETASGRIDGAACTALGGTDGVRAAGAVREADPLVAVALPAGPIPAFAATPGFVDLLQLTGSDRSAGVLVSDVVAMRLGVQAGDTLATAAGEVAIRGVFAVPEDGRDPALQYAVVGVVAPDSGPFDACWTEVWPFRPSAVAALQRTVLPASDTDESSPTVGQLNPTLGERFEPRSDGSAAVFRAAAMVVGAGMGFATVFARRLELATARGLGVGVRAQVVVQVLEYVVAGVAAGCMAFAAASTMLRGLPGPESVAILTTAVDTLGPAALAGVIGAAAGVLLTSSSAQYRYFKRR